MINKSSKAACFMIYHQKVQKLQTHVLPKMLERLQKIPQNFSKFVKEKIKVSKKIE